MIPPLRIAIADDERDMREYLQQVLPRLGHTVVSAAETGRSLVQHCLEYRPDLVITDIRMPDMDGIQAAEQIYRTRPVPVILISAFHDPELIERAEVDHVMAYLVKPVKQAHLEPAIALAWRRFEQFEALRREAADLRQALADRKLIERAKGVVMRRAGVDEPTAFRRLQRAASRENRRLVEMAQMVIAVEELLADDEPP
jgi:response regulator NasT